MTAPWGVSASSGPEQATSINPWLLRLEGALFLSEMD
jgi:hypothetical protein